MNFDFNRPRTFLEGLKEISGLVIIAVKAWLVIAVIVAIMGACGILVNNTIRVPPEPFEYEVIEFLTCKGWNGIGAPKEHNICNYIQNS